MPLVKKMAMSIHKQTKFVHNLEDMEQSGFEGLLDGLSKYQVKDKASLETYVNHRIKGSILDSLRKADTLSQNDRALAKIIHKSEKAHLALYGCVNNEQICQELGIQLHEFHDFKTKVNQLNVVSDVENEFLVANVEDLAGSPQESYSKKQETMELMKHVKMLNKKEQLVLHCIYTEDLSNKEIAEIIGVSAPRISQMHKEALSKLKKLLIK